MTGQGLIAIARQIAAARGLSQELICGIIERETSWNPWAIRYEPEFMSRYVAPLLHSRSSPISPTEAWARAFSWGLMQVMGQVAREQGYTGPLAQLCDPSVGVETGCIVFESKLAAAGGDVSKALLAWNGGANPNYAAEVLELARKYR